MNQRDKLIMQRVNHGALKETNMLIVSRFKYRVYQTITILILIGAGIIIFSYSIMGAAPEIIKEKLFTIVFRIELSEDTFNMITNYIDMKINETRIE